MRQLLLGVLVVAGACRPPQAHARAAADPDHRVWTAVPCDDCTTSGVRVDAKRSSRADGRAGKYVYTRVSNLNPYAIVFTLDVTPHRALATGDPDVVSRQWRLTLPAAEHPHSSTVVSIDHDTVASARVYAVERF